MARRIVHLTPDRLEALGEAGVPCRACVRWELDAVRRDRVPDAVGRAAEKDTWLSEVLREWGSCGRVAVVDDVCVGYLVYAPAAFLPGAARFPTAPVSPDAVLLTTAYVAPGHTGGGLGRMLVQAMAADLVRRGGVRAVEAFGSASGASSVAGCVVPADFLARVGFKTHRAHPVTPRLRMELSSALTWKDEMEAALERLAGLAGLHAGGRPKPAPGPTRDGLE